jgi:phosphoglycerol transferase MdoB-like AlkP superfamily enzyme
VLESFGSALIGPLGGDSLTTPEFNRHIREGVLFTNFYASGNRTDKAMPAILNGYPAQPAVSIMKEPKKTQSLPGIVKAMNGQNYENEFWYGGEINFANFNSFVINSGFKKIITMHNFSPEYYNSKWGVHDHILFKTIEDSMKNVREPFLKVILTLSSHEPFEVPMDPVFKGGDDFTKYKNSIYYTDRTIGSFLDWAKNTDWWKNTLVILVADHCRRNSIDVLAYSEDIFRIPMLWLGGALAVHDIKIDKYGSQVDIPLTLLHQLDMDDNYPFSKDLLSPESKSFAFYTFNEGFGFVTDSSKYMYDHKLGEPVIEEGSDPDYAGRLGKAYLEVLFDDYLKR